MPIIHAVEHVRKYPRIHSSRYFDVLMMKYDVEAMVMKIQRMGEMVDREWMKRGRSRVRHLIL